MFTKTLILLLFGSSLFASPPPNWSTAQNTNNPYYGLIFDLTMVYNESTEELMTLGTAIPPPPPTYSVYSEGSWSDAEGIPMGESSGVYGNVSTTGLDYGMYGGNIAAWSDALTRIPYFSTFHSGSWTTASTIPLGESTGVLNNVNLASVTSEPIIFAAWADVTTNLVYVSMVEGPGWTPAVEIPLAESVGAYQDVYLAYDVDSESMYAAWADLDSQEGYVSIYNGSYWTTTSIPMNGTLATNITLAYYPNGGTHEMVAIWYDTATYYIYYSVYSGSWSTASRVNLGSSDGTANNVLMGYDSNLGQLVATWKNSDAPAIFYSYYSSYGMTNSWAAAQLLASYPDYGTAGEISLAYDNVAENLVATWSYDDTPYSSTYNGSGWAMPTTIPLGDTFGVTQNVSVSYDSLNNQVIAAWSSGQSFEYEPLLVPFSSIYNGTSWEAPVYIPFLESLGAYTISAVYDSGLQQVFAVWPTLVDNGAPYFSVYTPSGWTAGQPLNDGEMGQITLTNNVSLAYDPVAGQIICAWADLTTSAPTFSTFSDAEPMSGWTLPSTFNQGTSSGVEANVNLVYDAENQQVIAAWADNMTNQGYYSIYNGTSWSDSAETFPTIPSSGISNDVSLAYIPDSQEVVAAWKDSATGAPYSTLFQGSTWSTLATAIPIGSSSGVDVDVSLAYNPYAKELVAGWIDSSDHSPYYSFYSDGAWSSEAEPIPPGSSTGIGFNAFCLGYNGSTRQVFANWGDLSTVVIYYSTSPATPPLVAPPRSFGRPSNRR